MSDHLSRQWRSPELGKALFSRESNLSLWLLAIIVGLMDILTTWIGIGYLGLIESNAYPAMMINEYGLWVVLPLKVWGFVFAYAAYRLTSLYPYPNLKKAKIIIPAFLFLTGLMVVLNNIYHILSIVL